MRFLRLLLVLWSMGWAGIAAGQGNPGPAMLDPEASRIHDDSTGIAFELTLSAPVAYRAFLMNDPPRLVLDFEALEFGSATPQAILQSDRVGTLRWGVIRPGWSRMVAQLDGAYRIALAGQQVGAIAGNLEADAENATRGGTRIHIRLEPVAKSDFNREVARGVPQDARWILPGIVPGSGADQLVAKRRQTGARPLNVMLDPGHGGIDPGAEAGGLVEARLTLEFSLELAKVLRQAGMVVGLTRQADVFVPLETRISIARAAGADLFLSLHADALQEGQANGATVYTLSQTASDAASGLLAQRHDRGDLLAGVDLTRQDDVIAGVLMEMARLETRPRAERLAKELVAAIGTAGGRMHPHPIQSGGFSVLKSPDIPSVLLELGFLSSRTDRARLADPVWRGMMIAAIEAALQSWAMADAAEARLIRR